MRIMGQPEVVRRRLDLELNPPPGGIRHVEVIRGRAGYGFTVTGQGPCLLSAILEGGLGAQVGLKQGDRLMAVNGADVSNAPHETVVQLIGTCNGPLRLAVLAEGRTPGTPTIGEHECDRKDLYQKASVFHTVSDGLAPPAVCSQGLVAENKPRPVSEPDISRWAQRLDSLVEQAQEECMEAEDGDSICTDPEEEAGADWSLLNMTMVVGYLSSTELLLSTMESEGSCLVAIRQCIRQLGTEQDTHTLVLMKVMFNCVRLCDDAGAVLAAFPAENLLLGAVCAEDARFFCLVTTANVSDVRAPQEGPLRASCHVFFVDPELGCHRDHMAIAGRFGFRCTLDPDAAGCLEFPPAPQDVLHFVSVLYGDMGEAVERIRVRLDAEALPLALEAEAEAEEEEAEEEEEEAEEEEAEEEAEEEEEEEEEEQQEGQGTGKQGSASSTGDSGIGNTSPPEERTDRDFPTAEAPGGSHTGVHLPSCPWDYPADEELTPRGRAQTTPSLHCNPDSHLDEGFPLTESLPGPDALRGLYGGPPPRLEFQFKPPPPPLPPGKKQNFLRGPLRNSQRWFSRQKGPKGPSGPPETQTVLANVWPSSVSLDGINANFLPPPMSHINTDGYGLGNPGAMLPPKEDWTKRFLEQNTKHRKEGHNKGPRSWSKGARMSGRRPGQRLSMARSLDDFESAASSDGDYGGSGGGGGGGVQLQGCCSQSSLTSNGSLPAAAGVHRRLSDQRVASWAACFERLLQDPIGVRYFSEFLKKEFSEENILFWQACEYFSHVPAMDKKKLSQRAGDIYDSFLSSKATTPVNIDSQAQLADDVLTSPRPDMFKTQQLQIFNLMKFDSYSRFLKSSLYQECMLAEVEGRSLPDPYQIPCSPAPSKHSASSERSGLSTPKKESRKPRMGRSVTEDAQGESADKKRGMFFSWSRNRSFGKGPKKKDIGDVNLDYWGSNGRRESQGSLSSGTSMELTPSCSAGKLEADNRQSVAGWDRAPGGPQKQCSVTLPDGSCSVVVLRGGATIREVLRDLCHNMAVNMAAVDLFLVGGEKPLVLDQDCMTLSAHDIRMEKRTLFRLDLIPINRSVGLKAKPTKPVTEVLRPVVAKYGLHLSDLVAKISGDSQPLDLGAPISSLDGLRVVLERADPAAAKAETNSKSSSLKGYPPTRSLSATGDERPSAKDFSLRASAADAALPREKRKQKKINIDEAEEFFELLSRAQSSRANDQRGLLSKEDLVLPDFLRLAPPTSGSFPSSASTPDAAHKRGRENSPRGSFGSSLRSESLDSPLGLGPCGGGPNGHSGPPRRALLLLPRHPPFGTHLSPIARSPEPPPRGLRTVEEDLTLTGEGDISSPNSTLLLTSPPSGAASPQLCDRSLPEANFTPPPPCARMPPAAATATAATATEKALDPCANTGPQPTAPPLGAPEGQATVATTVAVVVTPSAPEMAMDMEGVHLEEGAPLGPSARGGGEVCPELSLSFQGYVEEIRQCQSKMSNAQGPQAGSPTEDPKGDLYKATIV